jgi:beta-lactamase regulating signal transducer with metallopeptidase domain/HEAT repeat protein
VNLVPMSSGFPGGAAFLFLLEFAWKGTLLLGLAALVAGMLRRASAAHRHLVWACALAGLVALPMLLVLLPDWSVRAPVLDRVAPGFGMLATAIETPAEPAARPDALGSEAAAEAGGDQALGHSSRDRSARAIPAVDNGRTTPAPSTPVPPDRTTSAARPRLPWGAIAFTLWAIGALAVLATFVSGHVLLRMLLRGARPVRDGEWHALAHEAADHLHLTLPFALLRGDGVLVPVATGLLRPRVLLPAVADAWPVELRRAVLLHELAHVQRHDCLTQAVAQVACAILWFHPAVWWAAARLQAERERACDDRVLAAHMRASDYADHLLGMVKSLRATRLAALGGVAFARASSLEGRLLAVLDPRRDRSGVGRRLALAAAFAATLLLLPFAALEPIGAGTAQAHKTGRTQEATIDPRTLLPSQVVPVPEPDRSLEQRIAWARADADRHGARVWWVAWPIETSPTLRANILSDSWGIHLDLLGRRGAFTLADVLAGRTQGTLDPAMSSASEDPQRTAIVLLRMDAGTPDRVRVQSPELPAEFQGEPLYWIEGVTHAESFATLQHHARHGRTDRLRARFVESVGFLSRSELVTPWLTATFESSSSPEVRAGAAEALARHPSPAGVRLLSAAARKDPSPHVRRTSVEALGRFQTTEALEALIAIAREAEGGDGTRRAAFEALGEKVADAAPLPGKEHVLDEPSLAGEADPHADVAADAADAETDFESTPGKPTKDEKSQKIPHAELEVQRQAIESLGRYPEAQSLPRLRRIADSSPNGDLRAQAVESIARLGTPAALEAVEEIAWNNTMSRARQEAVESIGRRFPPTQAIAKLSRVIREHSSLDARRIAVESMGRMEGAAAREELATVIAGSNHPDVQRQAVESLGRRSEPGTEDELHDIAREHRSVEVRRQAVESLGRLKGARVAARLMEIARGKGPADVKRQATESLGRRSDVDTRRMLLELAHENGSLDVQRQAVESLARLEADVMPDLAEIARTHPSGEIRRQAVESMTRRDPDKALPLLEQILRSRN